MKANVGCPGGPYGFHGPHLAAQRPLLGALGAPYGRSEAAFGCKEVTFCCTGAVYGSHAADMQYMLHLAGLGWQPGSREHAKLRGVGWSGAPNPTSRMRDQASRMNNQGSRMKDAQELKAANCKMAK